VETNCPYIAAVLILYLIGDLFRGLYILQCINDSFCAVAANSLYRVHGIFMFLGVFLHHDVRTLL